MVDRSIPRPALMLKTKEENSMHAIELASLASTMVQHLPTLSALGNRCSRDAVQSFWLNNRFRHDNWSTRLSNHRQAIQGAGVSSRSSRWHEIIPVMQEVLLSEPLTRCIAYFATVLEERPKAALDMDDLGRDSALATLAQSSLAAHVESRHRCLHLIVFGQGLSVEHAVKLNRMRRVLEAYSDQLLAVMRPIHNTADYAFDSAKLARSQAELSNGKLATTFVKLHASGLAQGLRQSLQSEIDWRVPNPQFNLKLSQAVLGLLPRQLFDDLGLPKTEHNLRFTRESLESTGKSNDFHSQLTHPLSILFSEPRAVASETRMKPRW
jgi:hypothetical protein